VSSIPAFAASTLTVDNADLACSDVTGAPYCTIQAAINAAADGDTVYVKNGTYAEALNIYKSLTLEGQSRAGVIINASSFTDYGIDATDSAAPLTFIFRNFTLDGPDGNVTGRYGLKVSGDAVTVTIEDVTVFGSGRTGVDLNGANGTLLRNVTSINNGGAGIALTNSTNVTLENITTSGNAWGGLAIYTGSYFTPGTANITVQGVNSFGEPVPVYIEPSGVGVVKSITISGFTHVVQNPAKPNHFYLQPSAAAANTAANAFPNPALSLITAYMPGVSYVASNAPLQTVINAASVGDTLLLSPGLYTQNITIDKHLKLIGAGSGSDPATNTVLRPATGNVVTIAGSGVSDSDPLLLKNLRVEPQGTFGINVGNGNDTIAEMMSYLRLENVKVAGMANQAFTENERCLNVGLNKSVAHLTVVNSGFSECDHGWYFTKHNGGTFTPNTAQYVTVTDSSFVNNSYKGAYIEMLSDATFENVVVTNNGSISNWNAPWNAGIDVNLKGQDLGITRTYQNLIFRNMTMTGNGLGMQHGAALVIKARDDSGGTIDYSLRPAALTNVLIENGVFSGNERGIRFGEPGRTNAGPTNVQVHNAAIFDNNRTYGPNDGSVYGGLINISQANINAELNWWGSVSGPSGEGAGTGDAVQDVLTGVTDFIPWLGMNPAASLYVPDNPIDLPSTATSFTLPVMVNTAAGTFSSVAFSLDYDTACLSIDPADANGDGIPDAISGFPGGFVSSIALNTADTAGELDVALWDPTAPLATMPNGPMMTIKFNIVGSCLGPDDDTTYVKFSSTPAPSFSNVNGKAVSRISEGANPLLLDYNQSPTDITLAGATVAENQPAGTVAGTLSVADPDGDTPVYSLVSGCAPGGDADNNKFAIAGGNNLVTTVSFDFETLPTTKNVCIKADDGQGGSFTKAFVVTVTNVNEAPTSIDLSNNQVAEGAAIGTVVGIFSTTGDPDHTTGFVYSLASGDGSADNAKFTIAGNQLKTAANVDFSVQSVFYIRVRSADPLGLYVEKQFAINVLDHSKLSIGDNAVIQHGETLGIPVVFTANGNVPTNATFKVAYNPACLTFVSSAPLGGAAAGGVVTVNTNGPFTNGTLVTLNFTAIASCQSGTTVPLTFTSATLTAGSNPLPVETDDGQVLVISNSSRGDCNSDGAVNAGDFSAIVLETFDADTPWWLNAPQSTFPGSPRGCDANASQYIDVADVVCTVLVVFGNSSCTGTTLVTAADVEPATLAADPAVNGATVEVPVTLAGNGAKIAGAAFTLTYDPAQAAIDMTDADGDGLPDAVVFATGSDLKRSVSVDAANGRIKIAVYGLSLPLPTVADGELATIRLQALGDQPLAGMSVIDAALGNHTGSNTPVDVEVSGTGAARSLYLPAISN
jgi:hypothetical protein